MFKRNTWANLLIAFSWVLAVIVGYLVWGVLVPHICSTLPNNDWHGIMVVLVYYGIGSLGGISIPLIIGIGGTAFGNAIKS